MTLLSQLEKKQRKELLDRGTLLYKSGVQPTPVPEDPRSLKRSERRQLERALGYRGAKAKRHNIERQRAVFQRVMATEEVLDAAQERVNHPIRSRLRKG